jgi:hypothetical protein
MTTPSTVRKAGPLLGNGSATAFSFTFKVFAASDIAVTIANNLGVETALVLNTDYSVTLNSNQETSPGGTVTYPISGGPLPTGSKLTIIGNLPYDQPLDLPSGGNFSPLALENQLDRTVMQVQQLREQVGRALQLPVTADGTISVQLPQPEPENIIGWNQAGTNLENYPLADLATALAFATYRYDTFNGNGSTTQFTLSADPITLGNLDVAISGVTQVPGVDYTLANGVLQFTSAPANGTTILARFGEGIASGPSMDSYDVRFRQAGTGSVDRTAESKLRETVSVKDFGAVGDGVTDDTAAIQAAVDYGVTIKGMVFFPAGKYLVTDTINLPIGAQLVGETGFQLGRSFGVDPKATTINFQPTSLKSLFVATGTSHGGFRFHYSIEGFYLRGNSTDASGNSLYALDLDGSIYARYENIGIEQFRTAIRCSATINNRFCNIYASGKVQAVLYAGNIETTDVWEQCSFWGSPIGVQTAGSSIAIRFSKCLFEQLDTYGVNLTKETQNFIFENCYSEDVCFGGSATSAMFRVGFDGSAAAGPTQLTVIGGFYAGRNAGAVGSFIDADVINGVIASNFDVRRFTNGVQTSASTPTNTVVLGGGVVQSLINIVTDVTKVSGVYPHSLFSAGTRNVQNAKFRNLTLENNLTTSGVITPTSANVQNIGSSSLPFNDVYVDSVLFNNGGQSIISGTGNPEGVVAAGVGSLFLRRDSGGAFVFYVKTTGTGNTGWVGK